MGTDKKHPRNLGNPWSKKPPQLNNMLTLPNVRTPPNICLDCPLAAF